jgi:hypothetical protein
MTTGHPCRDTRSGVCVAVALLHTHTGFASAGVAQARRLSQGPGTGVWPPSPGE